MFREDREQMPVANGNADDPITSYILRSIRAGIVTSGFVLGVVLLYALLPGTDLSNRSGCLILIGIGAVLTIASAFVPWSRIVGRGSDRLIILVWAFMLIALIDIAIALTGGAHSQLFILLVIVMVFLAGPYYSLLGEVAMNLMVVAGYVITLVATGWDIHPSTLAFRLGIMTAGAFGIATLSNELMKGLRHQVLERDAAEQRVVLWTKVAALARQIDSPETDRVLTAVVDAVDSLGFEVSAICTLDEDGTTQRVLEGHNVPVSLGKTGPTGVLPTVMQHGKTMVFDGYDSMTDAIPEVVEDGFLTIIAGPVWVNGEMVAVLEGGSRKDHRLAPDEIAAFEMIADQAGRALENAELLERQRREADRFRQLLVSAPDAVIVINSNGAIVEVSNQAERLYGYSTGELIGQPAHSLVPDRLRDRYATLFDTWIHGDGDPVIGASTSVYGRHKDGSEIPVELTFNTMATSQGELVSIAVRDVTERREFERRLTHQATHDHLTGLPNRELFMQRLIGSLQRRSNVDPPDHGVLPRSRPLQVRERQPGPRHGRRSGQCCRQAPGRCGRRPLSRSGGRRRVRDTGRRADRPARCRGFRRAAADRLPGAVPGRCRRLLRNGQRRHRLWPLSGRRGDGDAKC